MSTMFRSVHQFEGGTLINAPEPTQDSPGHGSLEDPPQILLILFSDEAGRKPSLRARAGLPNEARVPFVNCLGLPERNRRYVLGGRMSNWGGCFAPSEFPQRPVRTLMSKSVRSPPRCNCRRDGIREILHALFLDVTQ